MERRLRRREWVTVLVVLVLMLAIAFWPTPVDAPVDGALFAVLQWLHGAGAPVWVDYTFVEVAANVVLFVPLGGLIASVMWPSFWWASGVLGLTLSLAIELGQYLLLPHRFASASDVIANTAGATVGGLASASLRMLGSYRSGPRVPRAPGKTRKRSSRP